ncbi:MAG: glycoside hydrolase family 76 protein [Acidimicrobiales bacterium]
MRRRRRPEVPDGAAVVAPADRAAEAWRALRDASFTRTGAGGLAVLDPPGRRSGPAAVWPLGQVLVAHADLELIGRADAAEGHALGVLLARYAGPDPTRGYGPFPGDPARYFDDNAWIGLWALQRHAQTGDPAMVAHAELVAGFVAGGQAADGGVRWVDRPDSPRNTCATAPFAALGLRLAVATGDRRWRGRAEAALAFLAAELRTADGLYLDNVDARGRVDPAVWSYNQGTPVGALVQLHLVSGATEPLDQAVATADAALAHYGTDDRLWSQPPAFNAIFFRNLVQLDAVVGRPAVWSAIDQYLDRAWRTARDPGTGLLVGGGIGRYEQSGIDQAALVQLYAIQAAGRAAGAVVT